MFGTPGRGDRIARLLALPLLLVFILVLCVFYIFFRHMLVEGESMMPALLDGDHVLITRHYDLPHRGDIVVARARSGVGDEEKELIKRVIAIEGDVVSVVRGVAYVNGRAESGLYRPLTSVHDITTGELVIPEGYVYILGDNRPLSYDSRFYGPAPISAISGKVVAVYAPITRLGHVD